MKPQREIFRACEADAWFERNRPALQAFDPDRDPVIRSVRPHLRAGQAVAEIGCSLAERVAALAALCAGPGRGVDPSAQAIAEAQRRHPHLSLQAGTADRLPWDDASVDLLVYGFCLYVCDRADLFRIAAEGDRVLRPGGLLAVWDFLPPFPYRNRYAHQPGVFSYKLDHARLWSWNPEYVQVSQELLDHGARGRGEGRLAPDDRVAVTLLRKLPQFAYPEAPVHAPA